MLVLANGMRVGMNYMSYKPYSMLINKSVSNSKSMETYCIPMKEACIILGLQK